MSAPVKVGDRVKLTADVRDQQQRLEVDKRNMRAARRQLELFLDDGIRERITVALALLDESVDYPPPGLPVGLEGTVDWVGPWDSEYTKQFFVLWDNGRRLGLIDGDSFIVIGRAGVQ